MVINQIGLFQTERDQNMLSHTSHVVVTVDSAVQEINSEMHKSKIQQTRAYNNMME